MYMAAQTPCPDVVHRWWQAHPPVGTFIAILSVIGVLVPLFREWNSIHKAEKALWTLLMFLLVFGELRTLYLDRDEHDFEQARARCEELENFRQIANTLEKSIRKNQEHFDKTVSQLNEVYGETKLTANTAKNAVDSITGGSHVLVLVMAQIRNDIAYPFVYSPNLGVIRSTHIRIVNLAFFNQDFQNAKRTGQPSELFAHDINFEIPDLGIGLGTELPTPVPLGTGESAKFNIFFESLNGGWFENLVMRKKHGQWLSAIRVFREHSGKLSIMYVKVEPGFLNDGEKLDWEKLMSLKM